MIKVDTVERGNIQEVFPTPLYSMSNVLSSEQNQMLVKKIHQMREVFGQGNTKDWLSGEHSPDNTFAITDLNSYQEFMPLITRVTEGVQEFARYFGSEWEYNCDSAWYNVYTTGRYQEFHVHPFHIFSAVYFLQSPKNCPGLYFQRPGSHTMLPPKNIRRDSPYHKQFVTAPPVEGTVVIFRSDMLHSVPPGTFDGERITIALNYS